MKIKKQKTITESQRTTLISIGYSEFLVNKLAKKSNKDITAVIQSTTKLTDFSLTLPEIIKIALNGSGYCNLQGVLTYYSTLYSMG